MLSDRANGGAWISPYIEQDAPLGLAHCVLIAQDFLGDDRFVMFLGDNVIEGGISNLISDFEDSAYNCQIVLTPVEEPQHYGVAELNPDRLLSSNWWKNHARRAATWRWSASTCSIKMCTRPCARSKPSWRGELEITDAIQWLVEQKYNVHPFIHRGWWIDTGKPIDMLAANSKVLEELTPQIDGFVDRDSQVDERVIVEAGAQIINSVVRGPTIIGENTRIVNSYVGPFTSIYHDCLVENAEIEHSLVLEHSKIIDVPSAHHRQPDRSECGDAPLRTQTTSAKSSPWAIILALVLFNQSPCLPHFLPLPRASLSPIRAGLATASARTF